jgi:hypothetical protein
VAAQQPADEPLADELAVESSDNLTMPGSAWVPSPEEALANDGVVPMDDIGVHDLRVRQEPDDLKVSACSSTASIGFCLRCSRLCSRSRVTSPQARSVMGCSPSGTSFVTLTSLMRKPRSLADVWQSRSQFLVRRSSV